MAFNIALDSKQFIHCRKSDLIGEQVPNEEKGSLLGKVGAIAKRATSG